MWPPVTLSQQEAEAAKELLEKCCIQKHPEWPSRTPGPTAEEQEEQAGSGLEGAPGLLGPVAGGPGVGTGVTAGRGAREGWGESPGRVFWCIFSLLTQQTAASTRAGSARALMML